MSYTVCFYERYMRAKSIKVISSSLNEEDDVYQEYDEENKIENKSLLFQKELTTRTES